MTITSDSLILELKQSSESAGKIFIPADFDEKILESIIKFWNIHQVPEYEDIEDHATHCISAYLDTLPNYVTTVQGFANSVGNITIQRVGLLQAKKEFELLMEKTANRMKDL